MCSCLQCLQLSELVHFLFWELSMSFYIVHRHRVCLVDCVHLICNCIAAGKVWGLIPQPHYPWVSIVVLFPPLHVGRPLGFAPEAALEALGLPCEGQAWRWCSCLGHRGSGSTRYSGELAARAAGNTVLEKGMATSIGQYVPVFLPGEPSLPTEKPGRPQSTGTRRVRHC